MRDSFDDLAALGLFAPPPATAPPETPPEVAPPSTIAPPAELFPPAEPSRPTRAKRRRKPHVRDPYSLSRKGGPSKNFESAPLWRNQALAIRPDITLLAIDALSIAEAYTRYVKGAKSSSTCATTRINGLNSILATILQRHPTTPWCLVFEPSTGEPPSWRTTLHSLYKQNRPLRSQPAFNLCMQWAQSVSSTNWPVHQHKDFEARDLCYQLSALNAERYSTTTLIVSHRPEFFLLMQPGCALTTPSVYLHPAYAKITSHLTWQTVENAASIVSTEQLHDTATLASWPSLNLRTLPPLALTKARTHMTLAQTHGEPPTLRVLARRVYEQRCSPFPSAEALALLHHLRTISINRALLAHPGDHSYITSRPSVIPLPPTLTLPYLASPPDLQPLRLRATYGAVDIPPLFHCMGQAFPMSWDPTRTA